MEEESKVVTQSLDMQFPANSIKKKVEPKKLEKEKAVKLSGTVIKREKSLGGKFKETFGGEDAKSVGSYVLKDVLVPAMKDTLNSLVTGALKMWLYGDSSGGGSRNSNPGTYINYTSSYNQPRDYREVTTRSRSTHDFSEYIFSNARDPEAILVDLCACVDQYGSVTVREFYRAIGQRPEYTDERYGWYSLAAAEVKRGRGGFYIHMPRPVVLD